MNIESLVSELPSNPILIIVAIIISLIPLLKFLKEIFIDFEVSRFRKIINTRDYESTLSPELRDSLIDARDRAVFERIHGFNVNKKYRDLLISIANQTSVDIDFEDIRRSFFHIRFKDNYMIIEYRPWINFFKKLNIFFAFFLGAIGLLCFYIPLFFYRNLSIPDIAYYIFIALLYLFLALDKLKQAKLLRSVIRILAQADQLPQYIKVDEDWWFKETLRKVGIRPQSFAERDFDRWSQ